MSEQESTARPGKVYLYDAKVGDEFGWWVVICEPYPRHSRGRFVRCRCRCGFEREMAVTTLATGQSTKCRRCGSPSKHRMSASRVYKIWVLMKRRCVSPSGEKERRNYAGRGIGISERWMTFEPFFADMGEPPAGYVIDRINNDGNYEPGNCRWTTVRENNRNRRGNRLTAEQAREIRESIDKTGFLAARFGVSLSTINDIRFGRTWSGI